MNKYEEALNWITTEFTITEDYDWENHYKELKKKVNILKEAIGKANKYDDIVATCNAHYGKDICTLCPYDINTEKIKEENKKLKQAFDELKEMGMAYYICPNGKRILGFDYTPTYEKMINEYAMEIAERIIKEYENE